jgi:hypothetical protein
MSNPHSSSRRGGLRAASTLVGRGSGAWGPVWTQVVGAATARESICLGPNEDDTLRIMVRRTSDRDELLRQEDHILAAWNTWAESQEGPSAKKLSCWVHRGSAPLPSVRPPGEPAAIEAQWLERAEAIVAPISDPDVRAAIVGARARSLRRRDRDLTSTSDDEPKGSDS